MYKRNWREYNRNLVQRGSLTFFCHPSLAKELKKARSLSKKGRGRPGYPNQLILVLMLLKISYGLTYRACEGMATSLFRGVDIEIPSYCTICRGAQKLIEYLPRLSRRRPERFLLDSSGFKITGEGEWKVKVHGNSYHRSWLKVHLLVDAKTNEIMDLIVTSSSEADINIGLALLKRISAKNVELLADGAYDGARFRRQAHEQGVKAVIPPPRNAKHKTQSYQKERNDALQLIQFFGNDGLARQLWAKVTGYNHRVKAESAFSRLKRLHGASVFSRNSSSQFVEVWLKAWLSNIWLNGPGS